LTKYFIYDLIIIEVNVKKTTLLLTFFIFLLLFSCKKKENQIIENNIEDTAEQEKYSLKSFYDISGKYFSQNTEHENKIMIDYGNKTLYVYETDSDIDQLDIDTMELIDNNLYKMTFNGLFQRKAEVPIILFIEITEQNKIKINCFDARGVKNFNDYSNVLNGVFIRYQEIKFTPTHILEINTDTIPILIGFYAAIGGYDYFQDSDDKFLEMILRSTPGKLSREIREFPSRLKSGAVVQFLEIGKTETVGDITADWYKVRTNLGREGWIFSEYLFEFNETGTQNEIKKPLEYPDRQKIIGKWRNEDHYGKVWDFYENGTFYFSLIAHSISGKWKYINNKIVITEPLDTIPDEEGETKVKLNNFIIDVKMIDNNNMIFSRSKYIDDYFGYSTEDMEYIELKK